MESEVDLDLGCDVGLNMKDGTLSYTYTHKGSPGVSHCMDVTSNFAMRELYNNFEELFTPTKGMEVVVLLEGKCHSTTVDTVLATPRAFTCKVNGMSVPTTVTMYENHGKSWWHEVWDNHNETVSHNEDAQNELNMATEVAPMGLETGLDESVYGKVGPVEIRYDPPNMGRPMSKLGTILEVANNALLRRGDTMKEYVSCLNAQSNLSSSESTITFLNEITVMKDRYDMLEAGIQEAYAIEIKLKNVLMALKTATNP